MKDSATKCGSRSALLLGVMLSMSGCASDGPATKPTVKTVTTKVTPSPSQASLTALDIVACQQTQEAMKRPNDMITYLESGKTTSTFLIAGAFEHAAEAAQTSAEAATTPALVEALANLEAANTLAAAKADAWRKGTLDLAYEIQAVEDAQEALTDLCAVA